MSECDPKFPDRDMIEVLKPFIEISKYVITIILAMISVFAILSKINDDIEWSLTPNIVLMIFGVILNAGSLLCAHRVATEATDCITSKCTADQFSSAISKLRRGSYSLLAIFFVSSIFFWIIVFAIVSLRL